LEGEGARERIEEEGMSKVVCPNCRGEGGYSEPRDICRNTNRLIEHWFTCDRCQGEREIDAHEVTVADLSRPPVMSR
jgi:DnaJ-class molecular chaperone